ncbi:hypothetical protein AURDEDRAFT_177406 [Auricularia subglabra TFB-10046 SS5]|uniref:Uncharacterized protein n=1 Tax=Auricularia subglabra (strain TFB-10046 / SS5) TaxID=717982 RepID=J0WNU0_AURST|nr:hypothetical protein AURDEDRAFT_177406 [Auricularia subglabra TFB-10046 SS5]
MPISALPASLSGSRGGDPDRSFPHSPWRDPSPVPQLVRRVPIASVTSGIIEPAILEHVNHSTSLEALPIARPPTPRLASPSTPASMARGSPDCPDGHHHTPAPGTSSICPADARSR